MKYRILFFLFSLLPAGGAAQPIVDQTLGRVIRAIDLKVQRMQNETIWLQHAQKLVENELSRIRLSEIAGWSGQQQQLFSQYYTELGQVKSYLSAYRRVKDLAVRQAALVSAYRQAWGLLRNDRHFTAAELAQMQRVYAGMLEASAKNLDQVMLLISPNKTQMTDEQRLELLNRSGDALEDNYSDLRQFNTENALLSLQRAKDENEVNTLKKYYGMH